jgi:hypothetical protein
MQLVHLMMRAQCKACNHNLAEQTGCVRMRDGFAENDEMK